MLSTISSISFGGGLVILEIKKATKKFKSIPIEPIPSGEIPNSQFTGSFERGLMNLK
jgi:hypothetical protein